VNAGAQERRMTFAVGDKSVVISQTGQSSCSFAVSPVLAILPRSRWTGEIAVTTDGGCRWTATSDVPWLRLRSTGASGPGTLTYDADFNPETGAAVTRTAVVAIRWDTPTTGQNVRITQWGQCGVALAVPGASGFASDTLTVSATGGSFHYFVLTEPVWSCAWTVESADSWVSFDLPGLHQVRNGDGDLRFTVPPNPGSSSRRAVITIGEKPLTIVQQGR